MSRPVLRPRAVRDIEQIWTYTAGRWGAEQAERYVSSIRDVCTALASGERTGTDASEVRPGYRRTSAPAATSSSSAPCRTAASGIVRILHERMDLADGFTPNPPPAAPRPARTRAHCA